MRTVTVLVPDAEDPLALRAIRSLGRVPGVRTHLLTVDRYASARFSRFCHRWHPAKYPITHPGRRGEILALLEKQQIDVVLPVTVQGIALVANHSADFAARVALPPLPDVVSLRTANDKTVLPSFARQHGVPVPPFLVFPDDLAESDAVSRLTFPVLVKPPSMAGGKGIQAFATATALIDYLHQRAGAASAQRLLLQTYLPGEDLGLNVLCRDGRILAYTIQQNPICAAVPFGPAAGIRFVHDPRALEIGQKLLSALRYSGLANIDLRRCASTGEIYVLEMNPRLWGTSMGSTLAGVNFPYLACLVALGRPLPPMDYRHITFADKSATLQQALRFLRGLPLLPGFRFRHTSTHLALLDPLPMLVDNVKQLWKTRVPNLWKRGTR
jgi:D-aspartate ligase